MRKLTIEGAEMENSLILMSKFTIVENMFCFNVTLACVAQSARYDFISVNTSCNGQAIFKIP
jgi:hypothetical protein